MERIKSLLKRYREILMYIFIGGCTTAVNWIIYTALTMAAGVNMTAGNAAAWLGAVVFAFFTNKLLVFESRSFSSEILIKEAAAFLGARIVSGIIEIFLPEILYGAGLNGAFFGIDGGIAKLSVSAAVVILNYIFSKLIIFGKNRNGGAQ